MSVLNILKPIADFLSFINFKRDRLRLGLRVKHGLKLGKNIVILENVEFDDNYPFLIEIGDNCRISKDVRILAHDATTFRDIGVTRLAPVRILEGTYIGERVIILPGVTIGPRAMIAAGSVVNRDIPEGKAAAGNPARPYGNYIDILDKYSKLVTSETLFNKSDIENGTITKSDLLKSINEHSLVFIGGMPKDKNDPYYVNADKNKLRKETDAAIEKIKSGIMNF